MNIFIRHGALLGLLFVAWACTQHRTDGTQQASLLPMIDTAGRDLSAAEAQDYLLTHPDVVVLDVRTPDEFQAGHIKTAANVNLYDSHFINHLAKLDRSKTYVVHCAVGLPNGRSRKAVALMDSLGFNQIHHLNGGFSAWQQAGQPVVKVP